MQIINIKPSHVNSASKILAESYFDTLKKAKEHIKQKLSNKECLVAVEDDEVLGVLTYHSNYSHYANYIEDVSVAEKHRRKGVANELLKKFIEISRKETPKSQAYALSSTKSSNKASVKMHLKFGFKIIGRIQGLHYGEDEIIFGYRLH